MVDKNKNGIDDQYEKYGAGQVVQTPYINGKSISQRRAAEVNDQSDLLGWLNGVIARPVRQGLNWLGEAGRFLTGTQATPDQLIGNGAGDQLLGVAPGYYDTYNRALQAAGQAQQPQQPMSPQDTFGLSGLQQTATPKPLSLLDYLSQAGKVIDQYGIGKPIDYSPARADAQNSRDRNSAYLGAIYNQLRGGLQSDRGSIQQNYGDAIDRNQQITSTAQKATQGAYDAAQAKQAQDAATLGMGTAAASINQERPGLAAQAAKAVSQQADRGQNAQQMYNSQQANGLENNTNVQGASRFAETRSQAGLNASLANRLAELATLQSQANAQGAAQRSNAITQLAESMYGNAQNQQQQDYNNMLNAAKLQAQVARSQPQPGAGVTLQQLMQQQQDSKLNVNDFATFMKLLSQLN